MSSSKPPQVWASDVERRSNLTRAQYLIWSGQQLHPDEPLYNMAMSFRIRGPLDAKAFSNAVHKLVRGTDALRMVFQTEGSTPKSRVLDDVEDPLAVIDLSHETDRERALESWISEQTRTIFDLSRRSFYSALIRVGPEDHVWFLNQHHLTTDGWSVSVVFRRLGELYSAELSGTAVTVQYPQYELYVRHERSSRESESRQHALRHWSEVAADESEPFSFYGSRSSDDADTRSRRHSLELDLHRSSKIKDLAGAQDGALASLTAFEVLATVIVALVSRVTGRAEVSMLTPVHSRPSKTLKDTVGLLIEVLPMSVTNPSASSFRDLFGLVRDEYMKLLANAVPGASMSGANREHAVLFNFINATLPDFAGLPVESKWIHSGHGDGNHAMRVQVHDYDETGRYIVAFDLKESVFDPRTADLLLRHFTVLLDAMLDDSDQTIEGVDLLSSEERRSLLEEFNSTAKDWPHPTLVSAFASQVAATPDAVAVEDEGRVVAYRELDDESLRVSAQLVRMSIGKRSRVGIYLPRSADLVAALMGTLRSGAAYVPIDLDLPADRIRFLAEDSGIEAILTNRADCSGLPTMEVPVIAVDSLGEEPETNTALVEPDGGELAYILYTSGSTGLPKGVEVTHQALANYVQWAAGAYSGNRPADFPLHSPIGFDLTVTSIYVPLVTGGRIVVYREHDDGAPVVADVFRDDRVDVVKLTPAHLATIRLDDLAPKKIRSLILGGEDLKTELARRLVEATEGRIEVYNEYGPTEATVGSMIHRFSPDRDHKVSVPIGAPISNARIYVLDSGLRPTPVGVAGELCIGGSGVAAGYTNRDTLMAERFVADPFQPGGRIYRTGDLARWGTDGQIEFLGRVDHQVKIRGHRIELGELEATLMEHPSIDLAAVDVIEAETARLDTGPDRGCVRCGLSRYAPGGPQDDHGVCQTCHFFDQHRSHAEGYFGRSEDLERLLRAGEGDGEQDCLMLLSGGKDSTYALYQLVEMGFTPLVFTLDNGYISEGAKENMHNVCEDLGLELVVGGTGSMNEIFADSLATFANVCQGCFKTIYTLAINLAVERGIDTIVTGLSRGQIFETRLADLFRIGVTDPEEVDRAIVDARRAYHRAGDAASRLLPNKVFESDAVFDQIRIVDFYRYVDVGLETVLTFLTERAPWIRPADTGRSTNCLINATGIFVHQTERGYHNYAVPYAWDVRLGHKGRAEALNDLNDEIDVDMVRKTLDEVGYTIADAVESFDTSARRRLAAYYQPQGQLSTAEVRAFLADRLPPHMIPSFFLSLEELPLTTNGKIDRDRLPDPRSSRRTGASEAPRSDMEKNLTAIWKQVLEIDDLGVGDNFFELGGDSILNVQIVARARARGIHFTPQDLFEQRTVAGLALVARKADGGQRWEGPAIDPSINEEDLANILSRYGE